MLSRPSALRPVFVWALVFLNKVEQRLAELGLFGMHGAMPGIVEDHQRHGSFQALLGAVSHLYGYDAVFFAPK